MKRSPLLFVFASLAPWAALWGEPTEMREWNSTANTQILGKALGLKNDQVSLETKDGRRLVVPLDKLIEDDQRLLRAHFAAKLLEPSPLANPEGLPVELGKMSEPIDAGKESSYYLYLPTTLSAEYRAPLLFWTGSGRAKPGTLDRFIEASERTGMILAASVESKNSQNAFVLNHQHTKQCLKHLEDTLPVEIERVFFTGSSGGGATAFYNADRIKCAGAMPYAAYMPDGTVPSNGDHFFIASGARDYNRYLSAYAADELKEKAVLRIFPGGHGLDRASIGTEGLHWLYTRELYHSKEDRAAEKLRFEPRFLSYLQEDLAEQKGLAYYYCDHLLNTCEVDGAFAEILQALSKTLEAEGASYLAGRVALDNLTEDLYVPLGKDSASRFEHVTDEISEAAAQLVTQFANEPEILAIAEELGQATVGQ